MTCLCPAMRSCSQSDASTAEEAAYKRQVSNQTLKLGERIAVGAPRFPWTCLREDRPVGLCWPEFRSAISDAPPKALSLVQCGWCLKLAAWLSHPWWHSLHF